MNCIQCTETKPVLNCIESLVIGTLANSTAYKVYLLNSSNERLNVIEATSNNVGLLTINLDFAVSTEATYQLWVTLATATNIEERETISISSIEATCLNVKFQRTFENTSVSTATTQTLTI